MDITRVQEVIEDLKDNLTRSGVIVDDMVLFGSWVHGDVTMESDLDVAIISRTFEGKNDFERAIMTGPAEQLTIRHFLIPLDIFFISPREYALLESPFLEVIFQEGVSVLSL